MKKYLFYFNSLFLLITCSFNLFGQTNVSGFISSNTTWNLAGSPYIVVGNLLLSQGFTLTIDPGVIVKFETAKSIQIEGELIAIGTASNQIKFTSNQPNPAPGDWGMINFTDTAVNAVFSLTGHYISGSILKHCTILYGGGGTTATINATNSAPYVSNCAIKYSASGGIRFLGLNQVIDSTVISDNMNLALDCSSSNGDILLLSDTIRNNPNGGLSIYSQNNLPNYPNTCLIRNNVFINNGAIIPFGPLVISGFSANYCIAGNYFIGNNALNAGNSGIIKAVGLQGGSLLTIKNNYFINNTAPMQSGGVIYFYFGGFADTISCNVFQNNTGGIIENYQTSSQAKGLINNNIFDSNSNGYLLNLEVASGKLLEFSDNLIINNNYGGDCVTFYPDLSSSSQLLHITHNTFKNNNANSAIKLNGSGLGSSNFIKMENNNFLDDNVLYELYNNLPAGSPSINVANNFWGSTNQAHVDSMIYDFFDDGSRTVVYYNPKLTQATNTDTTCILPQLIFTIGINSPLKNTIYSIAFPNPFSTSTKIQFSKELKNGTLVVYSVFGEKVISIPNITGESVVVQKENMNNGIYLYEVLENNIRVDKGKLMLVDR